jgi:hypothetical protein
MDLLNIEKLQALLLNKGEICISIYMPTHPTGREQQQDPIQLKNLLSQARDRLEKRATRASEIEKLLGPAEKLLINQPFWQHQSDGLAIFITSDTLETYRLPTRFEPLLVIAENFHIKPVLPFVSGNEQFYILALSQNEVRLLQGNRYTVSELGLQNTPTSLTEALWFDDPERQLQFHTGTATPNSTSTRPSIFHGHGAPDHDTKTVLLRYFQKVNRGIMEILSEEQIPLVLAGVDYLLPIYQEANAYPHLIEDVITGNPDELSATELHQKAWELVKPIFAKNMQKDLKRYQELSGSERALASDELTEIVKAAHHGRVESLFVTLGVQVWGRYDKNQATVEQDRKFQPGDQDLLDLAATQTLLNGGKVYALEPNEMPARMISAIYRFSYQN